MVNEQTAYGEVLQALVFVVKTLQELQIYALKSFLTRIKVIKFDQLGCGVGGVLINERLD